MNVTVTSVLDNFEVVRGCSLLLLSAVFAPSVGGCDFELGPDPFAGDPSFEDAAVSGVDAGPGTDAGVRVDGGASTIAQPLDPNLFFCRVQPEVLSAHRCASQRECHGTNTGYRLDVSAESIARPTCRDGVPVTTVPASYYTNLARSRGEVRRTATQSDLYSRPIGRSHPVDVFGASSAEAQLLVLWIEGGR